MIGITAASVLAAGAAVVTILVLAGGDGREATTTGAGPSGATTAPTMTQAIPSTSALTLGRIGQRLSVNPNTYESPDCDKFGEMVTDRWEVSVWDCVIATTFAAGAPFHIAHGWMPEDAQEPLTRFELALDGTRLEPEIASDDEGTHYIFPFPEGLTGTHTFLGVWVYQDELYLRSQVTVEFTG